MNNRKLIDTFEKEIRVLRVPNYSSYLPDLFNTTMRKPDYLFDICIELKYGT